MNRKQAGFTIVELLIVIVVVGILASSFYRFFGSSLVGYLHLQHDASGSAAIASKSQRVASVLRSTTGIVSVGDNDLKAYAYFYPSDSYVSLVHYYLNNTKTVLYCDVTPMSSNPPIGTPQTTKLKTYTIADDFYIPSGGSVFTYLDASDTALSMPIGDLNAIKLMQINLAVKTSTGGNQTLSLQVQLRNRKTNL